MTDPYVRAHWQRSYPEKVVREVSVSIGGDVTVRFGDNTAAHHPSQKKQNP